MEARTPHGSWSRPSTRWFPGFWSRRRSWGCALEEIFRARSSQRRTNKRTRVNVNFYFGRPNNWYIVRTRHGDDFPVLKWTKLFFGKAWMSKLREGCLLELIRARSLQLSAMNTWEWMQRPNKFGLSAVNKWEWMWRSNNFVWFRRDSSGGKDLQESGCNLFWTSECHTYMWKDQDSIKKTLLLELNTETWNWNPFSSKWAKSLLETEN